MGTRLRAADAVVSAVRFPPCDFCRAISAVRFPPCDFRRAISAVRFSPCDFRRAISAVRFLPCDFCREISAVRFLPRDFCRRIFAVHSLPTAVAPHLFVPYTVGKAPVRPAPQFTGPAIRRGVAQRRSCGGPIRTAVCSFIRSRIRRSPASPFFMRIFER